MRRKSFAMIMLVMLCILMVSCGRDAAFEQEQVVPDSGTGEDGTAEQNIPDQTVTPEDGVQEGVTP